MQSSSWQPSWLGSELLPKLLVTARLTMCAPQTKGQTASLKGAVGMTQAARLLVSLVYVCAWVHGGLEPGLGLSWMPRRFGSQKAVLRSCTSQISCESRRQASQPCCSSGRHSLRLPGWCPGCTQACNGMLLLLVWRRCGEGACCAAAGSPSWAARDHPGNRSRAAGPWCVGHLCWKAPKRLCFDTGCSLLMLPFCRPCSLPRRTQLHTWPPSFVLSCWASAAGPCSRLSTCSPR